MINITLNLNVSNSNIKILKLILCWINIFLYFFLHYHLLFSIIKFELIRFMIIAYAFVSVHQYMVIINYMMQTSTVAILYYTKILNYYYTYTGYQIYLRCSLNIFNNSLLFLFFCVCSLQFIRIVLNIFVKRNNFW